MSRQQQLELLGLHCTICGGSLKFENCNQDFERYTCPSCGNKFRLPLDIDRFKVYRAELMKRFGSLSSRGAMNKPKQEMLYELKNFAIQYSDFANQDSQYHLFYIAALTENFRIKFNVGDATCQEAEDTYRIISDTTNGNERYPIDVYGKKISAAYKRWTTPRRLPLWSKLAIGISVAAVLITAPLLTLFLGRNLEDEATGVYVHVDGTDYGMFDKWKVRLNVNKLEEGTPEYIASTTLLKHESDKYLVYDMTMILGNHIAQPKKPVTVTIPIPNDFEARNTVVYYISSDGKCEILENTEVVDVTRTVTFEADHFSLYAIAERPFQASFLPENGSIIPNEKVLWGSRLSEPELQDRVGYTFDGWYNGSDKWNFEDNIVTDNITLKAQWIPKQYDVSFDSDGGNEQSAIKATFDAECTLPTPYKKGYKFVGWYSENGTKYESGAWTTADNLSLTARWELADAIVSFGNLDDVVEYPQLERKYGDMYGELPIPQRIGYDFMGWYTDSVGGTVVTSETVVTEDKDHTIYAHWDAIEYSIVFNANTPAKGSLIGDVLEPITCKYDDKIRLSSPSFSVNGWKFVGWATDASGEAICENNGEITNLTAVDGETVNLYAVWHVDPYTVAKYVSNESVVSDTDGRYSYTVYNNINKTPKITSGTKAIVDWSGCSDGNHDYISAVNSGASFTSAVTSMRAALNQPRLLSQGFREQPFSPAQKAVLLAS